jgi:hypothetical protein
MFQKAIVKRKAWIGSKDVTMIQTLMLWPS